MPCVRVENVYPNAVVYSMMFKINLFCFQLAFAISQLLQLDNNICFGLLCVACVPGGGLGHVAVVISQSDVPISLTMNLISIVFMLGMSF